MTDELDLAEIGRLARAAGGEKAKWHPIGRWIQQERRFVAQADGADEGEIRRRRDHIARMDPATTLRLLEMIDELKFEAANVLLEFEAACTDKIDMATKLRAEIDAKDTELQSLRMQALADFGQHQEAMAARDAEIERLKASTAWRR